MDTDKPLLYELRECTLKDYSFCEYIECACIMITIPLTWCSFTAMKNISLLLVRDFFVNFSLLTSFYFSFTPAFSVQSFSFLMLSVPLLAIVDCLRNLEENDR